MQRSILYSRIRNVSFVGPRIANYVLIVKISLFVLGIVSSVLNVKSISVFIKAVSVVSTVNVGNSFATNARI